MSVVYNSCNCPASTFEGIAFADMECSVTPDLIVEQPVEFQPNYMESVYEQNCGAYSLETSPSLDWFEFKTSGDSLDANGLAYPDIGSLKCSSTDNIGEHIINMVIKQDLNEPTHGFEEPYRGILPDKLVPFTLRINPCKLDEIELEPISDLYYEVGDPDTFQKFTVKQTPACGYKVNYSIKDGQKDWFEIGSAPDSDLKVQSTDLASVGVHTVKILASVDLYSDYTMTDKTMITAEAEMTIHIANPCQK